MQRQRCNVSLRYSCWGCPVLHPPASPLRTLHRRACTFLLGRPSNSACLACAPRPAVLLFPATDPVLHLFAPMRRGAVANIALMHACMGPESCPVCSFLKTNKFVTNYMCDSCCLCNFSLRNYCAVSTMDPRSTAIIYIYVYIYSSTAEAISVPSEIRCAQGRCGRCPPGSGVMSDPVFVFFPQ